MSVGVTDDVKTNVNKLLSTAFETRNGTVVPTTEGIALGDGAVLLDATYLYADLANSSGAAQKLKKEVTAKIIRSFLNSASRIINKHDGEIRSFDGDRVMAIFVGDNKNTGAARAALGIQWAMSEVIKPALLAQWPKLEDHWTIRHGVGIATGEALIVRGGVRGTNDLVSIGEAPNVAAKLSDLRIDNYKSYATWASYDRFNEAAAKRNSDGTRMMWEKISDQKIGGKTYSVMASTWWKTP